MRSLRGLRGPWLRHSTLEPAQRHSRCGNETQGFDVCHNGKLLGPLRRRRWLRVWKRACLHDVARDVSKVFTVYAAKPSAEDARVLGFVQCMPKGQTVCSSKQWVGTFRKVPKGTLGSVRAGLAWCLRCNRAVYKRKFRSNKPGVATGLAVWKHCAAPHLPIAANDLFVNTELFCESKRCESFCLSFKAL